MAFSGATDLLPELNRWLQIVEMETSVRHDTPKFTLQLTGISLKQG